MTDEAKYIPDDAEDFVATLKESRVEPKSKKESSEISFIPNSEKELRSILDACGVNYADYVEDSDRGPRRFFEELQSGKNTLILRTSENGEITAIRKLRVFRAHLTTKVDDKILYEFQLVKKKSRKSGEEVNVEGAEKYYASSKGLKANEQPEDVMSSVVIEDLGKDAVIQSATYTETITELREANPSSKMPWIDSEYDFYTYDVRVHVPEEKLTGEIVSEGRAWDTIRRAVPIN